MGFSTFFPFGYTKPGHLTKPVTWICAPRFPYENIESFLSRNNTLTKTNMEAENGDPLEEEMCFGGKLHQFQDSQWCFPDSKLIPIPSEQFVRVIRPVMQRNLRLESPTPSYGVRCAPCHSQKGHESYCSLGARQGQLQGHLLGRKMELRRWCLLCIQYTYRIYRMYTYYMYVL